jgi:hypothetical protein
VQRESSQRFGPLFETLWVHLSLTSLKLFYFLRFVEKKMALLKVKGEIQELLSLSQATLAKKSRIEMMVRSQIFQFNSFNSADYTYLLKATRFKKN